MSSESYERLDIAERLRISDYNLTNEAVDAALDGGEEA